MVDATSTPRAASRSWLYWGLGCMLILIALVLGYRQLTGSTMKEQREAAAKEREAKELAAKKPGNADTFSARLEARRKEAEPKAEPGAPLPGLGAPSGGLPSATTTGVQSSLPSGASPSQGAGRDAARFPLGSPQSGEPTDRQVDAYAALKEEAQKNSARKLGAWEAESDGARSASAGSDNLLARLVSAGGQGAAVSAPAAGSSQQLLEAYLRSQGGSGAPSANRDASFLKQVESKSGAAQPLRAVSGYGRYSLLEGSEIPVVMRTAVSSDLAGPCRAQVERNIYDSITQSELLIPAGSTVICTYNADVVQGQDRLLLAFPRLIFQNGSSVALGAMQAADEQGMIGAPAEVNTRFWRTFGSSFLIAAVTRIAERNSGSGNVTINTAGASSASDAAGVLSEVAKKSLERNINIKPELRLAIGDRLRVVVSKDMVLDPSITQVR
jgi:type IV secretion system protein TrbI